MTGRISIDIFSTLDGVCQAPGGPDEDTSDGFAFGGWQATLGDEATGAQIVSGIEQMDALLLGRRTYDIFAAYWPQQIGAADSPIARKLNAIPKYVASRGTPELNWHDSHGVGAGAGADLASGLADLRERHENIHVIGSIDFAHTLLAENLFDQLNLWVYPIVVGRGKRLFTPDGPPSALTLLSAEPATTSGTVLLRYGPTGGIPTTGDMT